MKKMLAVLAVCLTAAAAQAAVGLVDDFSGDLSGWTSTVILDNQNTAVQNTAAWEIAGGALQLNTTVRDGTSVEQYAMIKSGVSLGVGEELRANVTISGNQDIGLYVGGTTPTFNVRQDYVAIYWRGTSQVKYIYSRGFNGTAEYPLSGTPSAIAADTVTLFIARVAENSFETGWYLGGVRNVLVTRTPSNSANEADVIGIYADTRGTGILGSVDNVQIVPEPATLVLLGLGGLGLIKRRKA